MKIWTSLLDVARELDFDNQCSVLVAHGDGVVRGWTWLPDNNPQGGWHPGYGRYSWQPVYTRLAEQRKIARVS